MEQEKKHLNKIIILLLFLCLAALHFSSINSELNGLGGDNAGYVMLAKSMADFNGYRDLAPGDPLNSHWHPLFPMMLTPTIWLLGINYVAMHTLVVFCEFLGLILLFFFFRRKEGTALAMLCCAIFGLNYFVNLFLVQILTEYPSIMFTAAVLLLEEKFKDRDRGSVPYLWLPVLIGLTYMTRKAALTVFLAYMLYRLCRGQFKLLLFSVPLMALPYLLWSWRAKMVGGEDLYVSTFFKKNYTDPGLGNVSVLEFFERVGTNLERLAGSIYDFLAPVMVPSGKIIIYLAMAVIVAGFIHQAVKRKFSLLEWYVLVYVAVLAVWPVFEARKVMPVMPFVYFYFFVGIRLLCGFIPKVSKARSGQKLPYFSRFGGLPTVLSVFVSLLFVFFQMPPTIALHKIRSMPLMYPDSADPKYGGFSIDWSHYCETFGWITSGTFQRDAVGWGDYLYLSHLLGQKTPPDANVISRKGKTTTLFSQRRAITYTFYRDIEKQRQYLKEKDIDFILLDGMFGSTRDYLLPYLQDNSENFKVVAQQGRAFILQVKDKNAL